VQELYREHSPTLLHRLTHRTGCREIAHELTQEAFARLLRMSPARLAQIEQPEAYIWRVLTNLLRDRARAWTVAERSHRELELSAHVVFDQVAVLESRDTLRRLEQAIAKLKPKTREIFLAHRIEGLSYAEIALRTGLSIKGVEKQMSKAIAKIDRLLDRA
jgi:RNA polymerase sigma factor (sigma-70 family)